ncbi:haloalkane dehalogenase, putative [Ectocarpus siliculosus]|uniref:Haloalkane dehalogenase, putative n=1 Tax=Ectocarpus siliculosus TaxID=2880 RepID=D7G4Z6_ECTSI|nr:haloalkane dehalogenase, putative [Ectocarpus siliculosus]|eukprot:CBJ33759.1 haloalkane dehalogenase, putative [Ectocarpus siliculosus]
MGDSEKIDNSGPNSYTIPEHARLLFALLEALGVTEKVTLVIHDRGSGLGFHWAETHRNAVKGIAFMEGIVTTFPTWDHFNKELHGPIKQLRGPEGEKMALEHNFFIEKLLPGAILRGLSGRRARSLPQAFPRSRQSTGPPLRGLAHFPSKETLPTLWLSLRPMVPGLPHPRSPSFS